MECMVVLYTLAQVLAGSLSQYSAKMYQGCITIINITNKKDIGSNIYIGPPFLR